MKDRYKAWCQKPCIGHPISVEIQDTVRIPMQARMSRVQGEILLLASKSRPWEHESGSGRVVGLETGHWMLDVSHLE